jgi:hypothetical protein
MAIYIPGYIKDTDRRHTVLLPKNMFHSNNHNDNLLLVAVV